MSRVVPCVSFPFRFEQVAKFLSVVSVGRTEHSVRVWLRVRKEKGANDPSWSIEERNEMLTRAYKDIFEQRSDRVLRQGSESENCVERSENVEESLPTTNRKCAGGMETARRFLILPRCGGVVHFGWRRK